jgi:signal transduction histidine kinase
MKETFSKEQWLLLASGLAAIAVVTWILWRDTGDLLLLCTNLLFALVFLIAGMARLIALPPAYGQLAMPVLLALNIAAVVLFPYQVTLILSVVLAASLPYHLSPRQSWILIVIANLLFAGFIARRGFGGDDIAGPLTLIALQGFAISSSLARRRDEESRLTLAAQNRELQAARAVLARQSLAEERLRIAGELHDTIGHSLTALQLHLEALTHEAPDHLRKSVLTCKSLAAELLDDVRRIVREMPDTGAIDLVAALRDLEQLTPGVSLDVSPSLPEVGSAQAQQLVYCFREAIHNAVRHGGADRIEVDFGDGCFRVTDNGRGLKSRVPRRGFGLDNMQQRLAPFAGKVELQQAPTGTGCRLLLHAVVGDSA